MSIVMIVVALITSISSAYGLGVNQENKESPEYQSATAFLMIGLVILLGATGATIFFSLKHFEVAPPTLA